MDYEQLGPLTGAQLANLLASGAIRPDETLFLTRRGAEATPPLRQRAGALENLQQLVQQVHQLALENRHAALALEQLAGPNGHVDDDTLDVAFEGGPSGPPDVGPAGAWPRLAATPS
jgi:hypothetical protein